MPVLARSLGRLDARQIQLLDYGSAAGALRAYRNGVIDGVALPTSYVVELLTLSSSDRIVLVIGASKGGDALVASPAIRDVKQLKGRRIAVESGSLGSLVLSRALEHGGLSKTDVHVVPVDVSGQEAAYSAGAVDAVITYEPLRSTLIDRGAHDVFNSSMMPNEIVDVLVVHHGVLNERPEAITHLTNAWFEALDYLQRHPSDAAARVAPREDVTPEAFLTSLEGVQLFGREDNQRWFSGTPSMIDAHLESLADAMLRAGLVPSPVRLSGLSTGRFIQ
jgi:NitT/TauT family transport system substrate-binding protein